MFNSIKNRGTNDNMFLLRETIDHSLYTNSPLTIIFYDFLQCFDSIWPQGSTLCLRNAGIQLFYLVYKLNEHAKIKFLLHLERQKCLK